VNRMVVFLSVFLGIYGSVHLYILIKVRRAFYLSTDGYILLFVIWAFLMIAPIYSGFLEKQEQYVFAAITAWIGFIWMGALFIFICIAIPLDIYHIILAMLQRLSHLDLIPLMLSRRQGFMLVCLATIVLMIYGTVEAHRIRREEVTLRSAKLPKSMGRLRIVQISDVHIGKMTFPARVASMVAAVANACPDIVVSTGDLVDGHGLFMPSIAAAFSAIPAPLGKFAVTGNHEFYMGVERAAEFTRQAGFTLLRNRSIRINDSIVIAGVDDFSSRAQDSPEHAVLESIPGDTFTLLLKHRPLVGATSPERFDLQLSGHTHKGQMFPFQLVVNLFFPLTSGLHQISPGSHIYVHRGSGTWGPPFRILAPPEITIIDLLPES
jgi:predicted MPP superfamily phosphohydrolase